MYNNNKYWFYLFSFIFLLNTKLLHNNFYLKLNCNFFFFTKILSLVLEMKVYLAIYYLNLDDWIKLINYFT